ncbi:MAG: acetate kinase [Candidatus Omnitrophica bacterium]|nr:acetate kinase [Candidatus Omnitrophota bacterium]MCM8826587.1 acetate kinase [Candidatus Omnitrophota bacterium]
MKILTINCGSSSIKYKLYDFPTGKLLSKGIIERIGEENSTISSHTEGMQKVFSSLMESKVLENLDEIKAIGHRVVHGGEKFRYPQIINPEVMTMIEECAKLAPLHNPANLEGIKAVTSTLPKVKQVAVFDTAFHQTIPDYAYLYALPLEYYDKYRIRRYGFHGTSHQYVAIQASKILRKPLSKLKLITCHLGNGCSITAIDRGRSIDTSMGFTPLEGLIMGTRCGDIDVASVLYLMEKENLSIPCVDEILNKKSGLLGISRISNDVRVLKEEIKKGNKQARLALDMFIYRIKKYIGAYYFILGGVDAICFTAGIGENNPDIIRKISKSICKVSSKTKILVIPTDEEYIIASLTYRIVKREN